MDTIQHVEIEGVIIQDMSRCTIRWASMAGGGQMAVLYLDGKRVVKGWKVLVQIELESDIHGGNANTAD